MAETRFTPGPWRALMGMTHRVVWSDGNGSVCSISRQRRENRQVGATARSAEQSAADAHLIAAAPRLYAALDRLSRAFAEADKFEQLAAMVEAQAALAAARGEQP